MFDIAGMTLNLENRVNWVGIIGSRKANRKEHLAAYSLAYACAKRGNIIVSGLAANIDSASHKASIDAGGLTIAIVNTLKGTIYPKENISLANTILNHGCIIHPFIKETQTSSQFKRRFIERDILLAKLCPVICAVSDNTQPIDGGTRWALAYGKKYKKKVFRFDSNLKFHENPETKKCDLNWIPELDFIKQEVL